MRFHHWTYVCLLSLILLAAFGGSRVEKRREAPVAVPQDSTEVPPTKLNSPAPTNAEITQAVARIFGNVVSVPQRRTDFLSADLNGDGSDDLAVVVDLHPQGKRSAADQFANWSLQDVRSVELPPAHTAVYTYSPNAPRPEIRARQVLAVVHGYGPKGWRDAEAKQAYLLVHAAGDHLSVARISELERQGTPIPRMSANPSWAIVESIGNREVTIYWTGAQYAAADVTKSAGQLTKR